MPLQYFFEIMKKKNSNITEFCFLSKNSELTKVREFVYSKANIAFSNFDKINKLVMAVDEACSNLIHHTFNFNENEKICIGTYIEEPNFVVEIKDKGIPFNPMKLDTVDMDEYLKEFKSGGLGVHIIKLVTDEIEYVEKNEERNFNIFRIKMLIS